MMAGKPLESYLFGTFTVAADHPALQGHFPGYPVVPGVTVLRQVLALVETGLPACRAARLEDVKFLRPLRPGERCAVAVTRVDRQTLAFDCRVDRSLIARGTLRLDCME